MKNTIAILMMGILPAISVASGEHAGGHEEHGGDDMEQTAHDSEDRHGASESGHGAGVGRPGDPAGVDRTIEVTMHDTMRFDPAEMKFKAGDTVRFDVRNDGKLRHEMVIGTMEELREHAEMMQKRPAMQHEEPNMISLASGESGELVWQFDQPGTIDFACLQPGHLEAGMTGEITVQ